MCRALHHILVKIVFALASCIGNQEHIELVRIVTLIFPAPLRAHALCLSDSAGLHSAKSANLDSSTRKLFLQERSSPLCTPACTPAFNVLWYFRVLGVKAVGLFA